MHKHSFVTYKCRYIMHALFTNTTTVQQWTSNENKSRTRTFALSHNELLEFYKNLYEQITLHSHICTSRFTSSRTSTYLHIFMQIFVLFTNKIMQWLLNISIVSTRAKACVRKIYHIQVHIYVCIYICIYISINLHMRILAASVSVICIRFENENKWRQGSGIILRTTENKMSLSKFLLLYYSPPFLSR